MKYLWKFTYEEALSCIFPVAIFLLLAVTKFVTVPYIPRYDVLLICCIAMQWWMVRSGLETKDELRVITVFHLLGLLLEIFKVQVGSWSYPEPGYASIFGVPLFSGFMYASVASYMCQAWRRFRLQIIAWPSMWITVPFGAAIYLNFFTHHYIGDYRYVMIALLFVLFYRANVYFTVLDREFHMPLILSFFLIGFFVWLAENIATFFRAWQYPYQRDVWQMVDLGKFTSWFLLVIVTFIIVAHLKHVKASQVK